MRARAHGPRVRAAERSVAAPDALLVTNGRAAYSRFLDFGNALESRSIDFVEEAAALENIETLQRSYLGY